MMAVTTKFGLDLNWEAGEKKKTADNYKLSQNWLTQTALFGRFLLKKKASEKFQLIAMVGIRKVYVELVMKWIFFPQIKY